MQGGAKIAMTSDAQGRSFLWWHLTRLAPGTSGKFLKTQGASADPIWDDVPAGVTINTNADNRIISGSGTANTLNGEANLTYDGTSVVIKNAGTASDIKVYCETVQMLTTHLSSLRHTLHTLVVVGH